MPFVPPNLSVRWGDYFKPDPDDDLKLVQVTTQALDSKVITKRMAVEKLRRVFGIENVAAALDAIAEEAAENTKRFNAAAHAAKGDDDGDTESDAGSEPDAGAADGTRRGAPPQPPQTPGARGAAAPRARPR